MIRYNIWWTIGILDENIKKINIFLFGFFGSLRNTIVFVANAERNKKLKAK